MKHLFFSRLPKRGYRGVLAAALFVAMLASGAFSFAPAAHAASAIPQALPQRPNSCVPGWPCVTIWARHLNVKAPPPRSCSYFPSIHCTIIGTVAGGGERVRGICQQPGQLIRYRRYASHWWMLLLTDNEGYLGWLPNVFIVGGVKIRGVQDCKFHA